MKREEKDKELYVGLTVSSIFVADRDLVRMAL